ncbi:inorganic pyrophosphatase [Anaerolineae bacterium]|nr:inorganic pyrophosphatase [Anaerolineae bacterium]
METRKDPIWKMMGILFKAHPWHGIDIGENAPEMLTAFIEITPTDTIKYELDKDSGFLRVDRPQRFSNVVPSLYGFIPRTYCATRVAAFCNKKTNRFDIVGDSDPLDICVLSEKAINQASILLEAAPIGGFRMIDGNEADDKIIAVMKNDAVYGNIKDITDCPAQIIERLRHYFLTYKEIPGKTKNKCEITHTYGREEAFEVIRRSREDYDERFGQIEEMLTSVLRSPEPGGKED